MSARYCCCSLGCLSYFTPAILSRTTSIFGQISQRYAGCDHLIPSQICENLSPKRRVIIDVWCSCSFVGSQTVATAFSGSGDAPPSLDPELQLHIKRLSKKDSTTTLRALQVIILSSINCHEILKIIPSQAVSAFMLRGLSWSGFWRHDSQAWTYLHTLGWFSHWNKYTNDHFSQHYNSSV